MRSFAQWLEEKKVKGEKESLPPTVTSAPLRKDNQDYNGTGVKHDTADYNISDSATFKTKRKTVSEVFSGVGDVRTKPVNMGQSVGGSKAKNAPANAQHMQNAANQRVAQLDNTAQKEKDTAEKERQKQQDQRQKEAQSRQKEAQSQIKKNQPKSTNEDVGNIVKKIASEYGKKFMVGAVGKTIAGAMTSNPTVKKKPRGKK